MLLTAIRAMGECCCPRCYTKVSEISELGTEEVQRRANIQKDTQSRWNLVARARNWIFKQGKPFNGVKVESILKKHSWVPVQVCFYSNQPPHLTFHQSAFSAFREFSLNLYQMFVVELMHDIELGIHKSVFTHLIRMLYCIGENVIHTLNQWYVMVLQCYLVAFLTCCRYRQVPTFGCGTIRRFKEDASAMKKLAARNWEDLIQV